MSREVSMQDTRWMALHAMFPCIMVVGWHAHTFACFAGSIHKERASTIPQLLASNFFGLTEATVKETVRAGWVCASEAPLRGSTCGMQGCPCWAAGCAVLASCAARTNSHGARCPCTIPAASRAQMPPPHVPFRPLRLCWAAASTRRASCRAARRCRCPSGSQRRSRRTRSRTHVSPRLQNAGGLLQLSMMVLLAPLPCCGGRRRRGGAAAAGVVCVFNAV